MLHVLIQHHHLLLRAVSPDAVSAGLSAAKHLVSGKKSTEVPTDYSLQGLVEIFGRNQTPEAGKLVVQKIEEAANTMGIVSEIHLGIAGLAQGKLLAEGHHADGQYAAKGGAGSEDGGLKMGSAERGTKSGEPVSNGTYQSEKRVLYTMGNFEYLTGMEDVWLGQRHYDLRPHKKARLCLACLVEANAVDEKSALHFLEEIDPRVREKGNLDPLGRFSVIKIQDYFREPTGELATLGQGLIQAVGGNGKYYLKT